MERLVRTASQSKEDARSALKKQQDWMRANASKMKDKLISVARPLHWLLIQIVAIRGHRSESVF